MLTGQGTTISTTEGTAFTGALATFTSNGRFGSVNALAGKVTWWKEARVAG